MPSAEQRFTWHMTEAKEDHNRWWAKRMAFEGAGWPSRARVGLPLLTRNFCERASASWSKQGQVRLTLLIAQLTWRLRGNFGGRRQDRVASDLVAIVS
jgi:hypothetical protein